MSAAANLSPTNLEDDASLRRDIRRVVGFLGDTLVRQEGQEVLDLVERVRSGSREDREATARLLDGLELAAATRLVRAFVAYFRLANVTEQVHRARTMQTDGSGRWIARAAAAIERKSGAHPRPSAVAAAADPRRAGRRRAAGPGPREGPPFDHQWNSRRAT